MYLTSPDSSFKSLFEIAYRKGRNPESYFQVYLNVLKLVDLNNESKIP